MKNRGALKLHTFRKRARGLWRDNLNPGQKVPIKRIAEAVGCHTTYVQKLEAGDRTPGLKLAMKLKDLGIAEVEDWTQPADSAESDQSPTPAQQEQPA
jgi:transcriptional regulator with XRE-family HTH domain